MSELAQIIKFHDEVDIKLKTVQKAIFDARLKQVGSAKKEKALEDLTVEEIKEKIETTTLDDMNIFNISCPHCNCEIHIGKALDKEDKLPEEGDITVCDKCAEIAMFTGELTLRKLTPGEFVDLASDTDRARAITNVQKTIKEKRK